MISEKNIEAALLAAKNEMDDVRNKEREIHIQKIETQYEELLRRKHEYAKAQSISTSMVPQEKLSRIIQDNKNYLEAAKKSKVFINNDFRAQVPFFAHNLILIGGKTGDGKSTITANLAYHSLIQGQKVLVITNEETISDCYNRVTCLIKGWSYTNHESFSADQHEVFGEYIRKLSQRMVVIDDSYNDVSGQTTSLEGIISILESVKRDNIQYDVIILDYYQNVSVSQKNPALLDWEVQQRLATYLDTYKNNCMAPIVVLAQIKKTSDDKTPFKEALEGRKIILNKCTCAIQITADRENRRTAWSIEKSRFPEAVGKVIYTGYEYGKYVPYTPEFRNKVEINKVQQKDAELLGKVWDKE